eukprot:12462906-Alexandrium_andersonii.AAC.1
MPRGGELEVPILRIGYMPRDGNGGVTRAFHDRDRVTSSSMATASSIAPGPSVTRRAQWT